MPFDKPDNLPTREFLVRLVSGEQFIYRLLLLERWLVPAVLLASMFVGSAPRQSTAAASLFLLWALSTSIAMKNRLALLRAHAPLILTLEQVACASVFVLVEGWRGDFYSILASPIIFSSLYSHRRVSFALASAASLVVISTIGILHLSDGRGIDDGTSIRDWAGAPLLFFAAVVLISPSRALLESLSRTGHKADEVERSLRTAKEEAAVNHARATLTSQLHDDIRQQLTSIPARWRTIASLEPTRQGEEHLNRGAESAACAARSVKDLLKEYRPAQLTEEDISETAYIAEIRGEVESRRRHYFKRILAMRLIFASYLGIFLIDTDGHRIMFVLVCWILLLSWCAFTSFYWRDAYSRERQRKRLLVCEIVITTALLLFGTTRDGNIFWLFGPSASILATAIGSAVQAISFAIVSALASLIAIPIAQHFRWQSAPSLSATVASTVGFASPLLPALYVRLLLSRLTAAANSLRLDSLALERVRRQAALAEVRRVATPDLIRTIQPAIDDLRACLDRVESNSELIATERARLLVLAAGVDRLRQDQTRTANPQAQTLSMLFDTVTARLELVNPAFTPVLPAAVPGVLVPENTTESLAMLIGEAILNACSHGLAPVTVTACEQDRAVVVEVKDHGTGFNVEEQLSAGGLWAMHHHARRAGVGLVVESGPDGTTVRISLDGGRRETDRRDGRR